MRIVQVAPYFAPHLGGVESHVRDLAHHLARRGHEVHVVTSLLREFETPPEERRDGYAVHRVKPWLRAFSTPVAPGFAGAVSRLRPDVVHAHIPPPFAEFFAFLGARRARAPLVVTFHCDLEIPHPLGPLIVAAYSRTLGLWSLSQADRVVVTTESYHATSRAVWSFDPIVIPNAIDPWVFEPAMPSPDLKWRWGIGDRRVALYVGRIKFHKGLEHFVEAARYTPRDVVHMIVGEGDWTDRLRSYVRLFGVEEKVILAGRIPDESLKEYYALADVFVLPSVSRLEAFGIVGLEAMACGKPVVVSDIPGVREVIEPGVQGYIAEPMNPRDLARKITRIVRSPVLRTRMGRAGRRLVESRFSWDRVTDLVEEVYADLAAGPGTRKPPSRSDRANIV